MGLINDTLDIAICTRPFGIILVSIAVKLGKKQISKGMQHFLCINGIFLTWKKFACLNFLYFENKALVAKSRP